MVDLEGEEEGRLLQARLVTMSDFSSILFARPSFAEGAARAFDLANTMSEYNQSETGELADRRAFYADWCAIGDDIRRAMMKACASVEAVEKRK